MGGIVACISFTCNVCRCTAYILTLSPQARRVRPLTSSSPSVRHATLGTSGGSPARLHETSASPASLRRRVETSGDNDANSSMSSSSPPPSPSSEAHAHHKAHERGSGGSRCLSMRVRAHDASAYNAAALVVLEMHRVTSRHASSFAMTPFADAPVDRLGSEIWCANRRVYADVIA
jgi:hypothetical protein